MIESYFTEFKTILKKDGPYIGLKHDWKKTKSRNPNLKKFHEGGIYMLNNTPNLYNYISKYDEKITGRFLDDFVELGTAITGTLFAFGLYPLGGLINLFDRIDRI